MASSIWEEFKELFKTDEQKAKEKQDKVNEALDAEKGIVEQLKQLEDEYNASLKPEEEEVYDWEALFPSDTGIKEIEYTVKSDEDIENAVKQQIDYDKSNAQASLQDRYDKAVEALEEGKQKADDNLQSSYANLEKLYNELKERAENDALKRGMARSSVITSRLDDLSKAHMNAASEQEIAYRKTVDSIEANIAKLERERETALENLDIKYAIELEERIDKLKQERDKTVFQYEKYNNSVRETNLKYAQDREEQIAQYLKDKEQEKAAKAKEQEEYEKKYGYSGEKLENYAKRYEIALDFYTTLSPDIAVAALQASPNMKYYLGVYYDKLLSMLKSMAKMQSSGNKVTF